MAASCAGVVMESCGARRRNSAAAEGPGELVGNGIDVGGQKGDLVEE